MFDFQITDVIALNMDVSAPQSAPYRIGLVLIDGFPLISYSATIEPLRAANELAQSTLFTIRDIPVSGAQARSSSDAVIRASGQIGEHVDFDLVLVLAGGGAANLHHRRLMQWLRHLARRGVSLGGISSGPLILARAGLMDGYRMTVHWDHAHLVAETALPLTVERSLYTIDRGRFTCAGGTAPLDMMHGLIADHHGTTFARRVSDWLLHTDIRPPANPQRAGVAQRYQTTCSAVIETIETMEANLAEPLDLIRLAQRVELSERQLNRLFREKIGESTMGLYRRLRLQKAHILLTQTPMAMTEIALATGFAGSAHFSTAFRALYGVPPSSLRRN